MRNVTSAIFSEERTVFSAYLRIVPVRKCYAMILVSNLFNISQNHVLRIYDYLCAMNNRFCQYLSKKTTKYENQMIEKTMPNTFFFSIRVLHRQRRLSKILARLFAYIYRHIIQYTFVLNFLVLWAAGSTILFGIGVSPNQELGGMWDAIMLGLVDLTGCGIMSSVWGMILQ